MHIGMFKTSLLRMLLLFSVLIVTCQAQVKTIRIATPSAYETGVAVQPEIVVTTNFKIDTNYVDDNSITVINEHIFDPGFWSVWPYMKEVGTRQLVNDTTLVFRPAGLNFGMKYRILVRGMRVIAYGRTYRVDSLTREFTTTGLVPTLESTTFSTHLLDRNNRPDWYYNGDSIIINFSSSNFDLLFNNGKLYTPRRAFIEIVRRDSSVIDPGTGEWTDHFSTLNTTEARTLDGKTVKALISELPTSSFLPGNRHFLKIHLSDITGDPWDEYSIPFSVYPGYFVYSKPVSTSGVELSDPGLNSPGSNTSTYSKIYLFGDTVRLVASPTVNGLEFDHWHCPDLPLVHGSTNQKLEFVSSKTQRVIRSTDADPIYKPATECLLLSTDGNGDIVVKDDKGTILGTSGNICIPKNGTVQIVAIPHPGYVFDHLESDNSSLNNRHDWVNYYNPTANGAVMSVKAHFKLPPAQGSGFTITAHIRNLYNNDTTVGYLTPNIQIPSPTISRGSRTSSDPSTISQVGLILTNPAYHIVGYEYCGYNSSGVITTDLDDPDEFKTSYEYNEPIGSGGDIYFNVQRKSWYFAIDNFVVDADTHEIDSSFDVSGSMIAYVASSQPMQGSTRRKKVYLFYPEETHFITSEFNTDKGEQFFEWISPTGLPYHPPAGNASVVQQVFTMTPALFPVRDTIFMCATFTEEFKAVECKYKYFCIEMKQVRDTVVEVRDGDLDIKQLHPSEAFDLPNKTAFAPVLKFKFNSRIDPSTIVYQDGSSNIYNILGSDDYERIDYWTLFKFAPVLETANDIGSQNQKYYPLNQASDIEWSEGEHHRETVFLEANNTQLTCVLRARCKTAEQRVNAPSGAPMPHMMKFSYTIHNGASGLLNERGQPLYNRMHMTGETRYPQVIWHGDAIRNTHQPLNLQGLHTGAIQTAEHDYLLQMKDITYQPDGPVEITSGDLTNPHIWYWQNIEFFETGFPIPLSEGSVFESYWVILKYPDRNVWDIVADVFNAIGSLCDAVMGVLKNTPMAETETGKTIDVAGKAATALGNWIKNTFTSDKKPTSYATTFPIYRQQQWFGCRPNSKSLFRMPGYRVSHILFLKDMYFLEYSF